MPLEVYSQKGPPWPSHSAAAQLNFRMFEFQREPFARLHIRRADGGTAYEVYCCNVLDLDGITLAFLVKLV